MDFMDRLKGMTREQAARSMVQLITHVSPEAFMKMALLASRVVEGEGAHSAVQAVIESLKEGDHSQAGRMFKRVMTELSPHCLKRLANALFVNGLLRSAVFRRDFCTAHGFEPPFTILISPTMQCNLKCVDATQAAMCAKRACRTSFWIVF